MQLPATSQFGQNGQLVDATALAFGDITFEQSGLSEKGITTILDQADIQRITYLSDGLQVKGYLAAPKRGERLPCVIFNRGGNREFSALSDGRAARLLGLIASWGYVAVASQYRGNAGGEGKEEFGGKDVNDILNLIPLLESLPQADAARIGMYGWSRGGMMTFLALTKTDRIAAAVIGSGIADLFAEAQRRPEMETQVYSQLIPDYPQNREQELAARSAVRWTDKLCKQTPILLLHGSADWRVHPTQAFAMALALYQSKHPFRFVFFEGGDHRLEEHRTEMERLLKNWLDHYVRDRNPLPNLEPHGQ